jgi:hypothetical protein
VGILRGLALNFRICSRSRRLNRYICVMARDFAAPEQVLHVSQLPEPDSEEQWNKWISTRALRVKVGPEEYHQVPMDFVTDFVSVPNAFAWLVPRAGRYARAAVLHDYLWSCARDEAGCADEDRGRFDRRIADRKFRMALGEAGVTPLRRWFMWAAVRLGAVFREHDGGKGTWKDIPGIVALLLIALPFVVPPAVFILLATYSFWVLDYAVARAVPVKQGEERYLPAPQLWT